MQISFHRFPKNNENYKRWIAAIKRDEGRHFQVSSVTKVCSRHFLPEDFLPNVASGLKLLRDSAVPSLFSFKKPKQRRRAPRARVPPPVPSQQVVHLRPNTPTEHLSVGGSQSDDSEPPVLVDLMPSTSAHTECACTCNLAAKVASLEEELVKHKEEIRKQQIEINASRALLKERNDQVHKLRSDLEDVSTKHRKLQEESRSFGIQKFQSSNGDV